MGEGGEEGIWGDVALFLDEGLAGVWVDEEYVWGRRLEIEEVGEGCKVRMSVFGREFERYGVGRV